MRPLPILPGFLAVLGIPAAVLGTTEGIADAVASFTKMASGYLADRLGHRKLLLRNLESRADEQWTQLTSILRAY
jgi:hypothetical protein